jgi:hypothetical protein
MSPSVTPPQCTGVVKSLQGKVKVAVGVITDTNTLADLRSRIAEADEGAGVPLDIAWQRWRDNAVARERAQAVEAAHSDAVITLGAAAAVLTAAVLYRLLTTGRSAGESEHSSVDAEENSSAAETSAPVSRVQ